MLYALGLSPEMCSYWEPHTSSRANHLIIELRAELAKRPRLDILALSFKGSSGGHIHNNNVVGATLQGIISKARGPGATSTRLRRLRLYCLRVVLSVPGPTEAKFTVDFIDMFQSTLLSTVLYTVKTAFPC